MNNLKIGDLVQFCISDAFFWDDTDYAQDEREYYGVGLVVEEGPKDSFLPEYLVLWTKIGQTTWEWEEFLQKIEKEDDSERLGDTEKILDSGKDR